MKSTCLKMRVLIFTSDGSVFCKLAMPSSIFCVSKSELVAGCFITVMMTAGSPRSEPSPILGAAPILSVATSSIFTMPCGVALMTDFPSSAKSFVLPMPRTMYSLPYSFKKPPDELPFAPSQAFKSSSSVTPKAFIFCGDAKIWYCLYSPPMTTTCATPPVAKSLGRSVQSAMVRKSICEVLSAVRLISIISPMILACGAMVGLPTPTGNCSATVMIFSLTICRALKISVFHSNSIQTIEMPADEDERTRRTLVAPLTAVSSGNVTSFSTSSGAMPCASVSTTTVGAVRSGNTSTSIWEAT